MQMFTSRAWSAQKYPSRSVETIYLKSTIVGVVRDPARPLLRFLRRRARRAQHRAPRQSRDPTISSIRGPIPGPASTSDATTQMDHDAVVLFTIDRLARSPRATVRTRGTELAPDR